MLHPVMFPPTDAGMLKALARWRRDMHRLPDLSGDEGVTAARVVSMLTPTSPDRLLQGLGGHGVAALYDSDRPGPRVLLRCELDGLPITETSAVTHRSAVPGKAHLCGHDGHMAILMGMAQRLGGHRPPKGSVVLMFQPAEEDGSGAAKVAADPAFAGLAPDWAFAIHNMPGMPLGHVGLVAGPVACASQGMRIVLSGRTAHASQPEAGISPAGAVADLIPALQALGSPGGGTDDPNFALVTLTHARIGQPAFGIAPGEAEVFATLRALTDARMAALVADARGMVSRIADTHGLRLEMRCCDDFASCRNDPEAVTVVGSALDRIGVPWGPHGLPMRPSEDFGGFATGPGRPKLALMMLGAGIDRPGLHNPDYDFPDVLIGPCMAILTAVLAELLGDRGAG